MTSLESCWLLPPRFCAQPLTKETSTPEKKKPAATHTDAPAIGSIEWRYWNENGSHNGLAEYYDGTLFTIPFVPNGDDIDMPLMSNNDVIIPGPVGQFSIGKNTRRIFYLNEDYQLIACDLKQIRERYQTQDSVP